MSCYSDWHPPRSWLGRQNMVFRVLRLWRAGLPLRTAAKILRKAGIHPWSLPMHSTSKEVDLMLEELNLPEILLTAIHRSVGPGLGFVKFQGSLPLPEGLVVSQVTLIGCHEVLRLPRRLWACQVEVANCNRLETLALGGGRVWHLEAAGCSQLRDVGLLIEKGGSVLLTDCPRLQVLPKGSRIQNLTLKDLPRIRALPPSLRAVGRLSLWRLPRIQNLSRLMVSKCLLLQDCGGLKWLPQMGPDIIGSVLDCPALVDQVFPGGVGGLLTAPATSPLLGGTPRPLPGRQQVEMVPLPGLEVAETKVAWPWPPPGFQRSDLDAGVEGTGRALGMAAQDRLRLHTATGMSAARGLRGMLLLELDPVQAVLLAATLLQGFLASGDLRAALELCLAAEQLGLGALSVGLSLRRDLWRSGLSLDSVLGPFWGPRAMSIGAPSHTGELQWHNSEGIPGPLVLSRWANISENTELRWMEGPVWAAQLLRISDCPRLEKLPDLIVAKAGLTIESCPRLRAFPRRLEVVGDLTLRNLPELWGQQCRILVGGSVRVEGCPGLRLDRLDKH